MEELQHKDRTCPWGSLGRIQSMLMDYVVVEILANESLGVYYETGENRLEIRDV